jgi:MinD-like ATPase involved in chromosome partitioning or flagellar assembly
MNPVTIDKEPPAERRRRGLLLTFYSYKGGVGRSMAVANVAALLARRGRNVLVVDWDLEAPGIERYFGLAEERKTKPGVLELVGEWQRDQGAKLAVNPAARITYPDWKRCLMRAGIRARGSVDVISAGRNDGEYAKRLQGLAWDELFDKREIGVLLEHLRDEWAEAYDLVLLDSRTGVSDIGGICTILMPDVLVALFTTSHQSIEGVRNVADSARKARWTLPVERSQLVVVPVPSREEGEREYELAEAWRDRFAKLFEDFYREWAPKDVRTIDIVRKLYVPYVTIWSFGERLPVVEKDEMSDPRSISAAYARLAVLLDSRLDWSQLEGGADVADLEAIRAHTAKLQQAATDAHAKVLNLQAQSKRQRNIALLVAAGLALSAVGTYLVRDRKAHAEQVQAAALAAAEAARKRIEDEHKKAVLLKDLEAFEAEGDRIEKDTAALALADGHQLVLRNDELQGIRASVTKDRETSEALRARIWQGPARGNETGELLLRLSAVVGQLDQASAKADSIELRLIAAALPDSPLPKDPKARAEVLWSRGYAARIAGDNEAAEHYWTRSVEAYPSFAPAYTSLGHLAAEKGDMALAVKRYREALARDPEYAPALTGLGALSLKNKDFDSAEQFAIKALNSRPGDRTTMDLLDASRTQQVIPMPPMARPQVVAPQRRAPEELTSPLDEKKK